MATDLVQAAFSGATAGANLDNFTPAAGAAFVRHATKAANPIVATPAGRMRAGVADNCIYYSPTAPPSADYSVRAVVRFLSLTGGDWAGPIARCGGADATFYCLLWMSSDGGFGPGLGLFKFGPAGGQVLGSFVNTLGGNSIMPTPGGSALLEVAVQGTSITGYFNGVSAITATDVDGVGPGRGGIFVCSKSPGDDVGVQVEEVYVNDSPTYAPTSGGAAGGPAVGTPTVAVVAVAPPESTVAGGSTGQFTAVVSGANSPSQAVSWAASLGSITPGGLWTAPAATSTTQVARITATSTVDTSKSGAAAVTVPSTPASTPQQTPAGPFAPSGATFAQLRSGGLSGQLEALIRANPGLDPTVVDGLRAGRTGVLDGAYRGLSSLVEAYLRGDPIATADLNARLGAHASIFAGYAQAAAELATLAAANPGKIINFASPLTTTARRSFD